MLTPQGAAAAQSPPKGDAQLHRRHIDRGVEVAINSLDDDGSAAAKPDDDAAGLVHAAACAVDTQQTHHDAANRDRGRADGMLNALRDMPLKRVSQFEWLGMNVHLQGDLLC